MAFTNLRYGFYNYNAGDTDPKIYDSEDMSKIFDGIITDGIYQNYKNGMWVKASEAANQVIISSGRAWFDHTWSYIDADTIFDLSDYPISEPYTRIDAVVLDVDVVNRTNAIKIVSGAEVTANPVKPVLINEFGHVQHGLAFITRVGGQSIVTQDRIEDIRGQAAYNSAYVTGVLSQMTIDQIVAQWEAEFDTWNEAQRESFLLWRAAREDEFITWFNRMKGQLSEDAAGRLQQEIDSIEVQRIGTPSANSYSAQNIMMNGQVLAAIDGSYYMEQTKVLNVGSSTIFEFTSPIISESGSAITVFSSDPARPYTALNVTGNTCSITFASVTSARNITVGIYIHKRG